MTRAIAESAQLSARSAVQHAPGGGGQRDGGHEEAAVPRAVRPRGGDDDEREQRRKREHERALPHGAAANRARTRSTTAVRNAIRPTGPYHDEHGVGIVGSRDQPEECEVLRVTDERTLVSPSQGVVDARRMRWEEGRGQRRRRRRAPPRATVPVRASSGEHQQHGRGDGIRVPVASHGAGRIDGVDCEPRHVRRDPPAALDPRSRTASAPLPPPARLEVMEDVPEPSRGDAHGAGRPTDSHRRRGTRTTATTRSIGTVNSAVPFVATLSASASPPSPRAVRCR